jgi:hypothetical protein
MRARDLRLDQHKPGPISSHALNARVEPGISVALGRFVIAVILPVVPVITIAVAHITSH